MDAWNEIRRLCDLAAQDRELLVERQLARIRAELPAYRMLPESEHRIGIARHTALLLAALRDGAAADEADLAAGRALGVERARQGFEVTVVMQAFQLGCSEVWDELVRRSQAPEALVRAAAVIWEWVHRVSTAAAEGHAAARATASAERHVACWQLAVSLLSAPGEPDARAVEWAQQLGFAVDEVFQVALVPLEASAEPELARRLDGVRGHPQLAVIDGLACVVGPGLDDAAVAMLTEAGGPVGIGAARPGLSGAYHSATDARRALDLARLRHAPVSWADSWQWAELAAGGSRLSALLTPRQAVDPVRAAPLIDTVRAYAASGFSVAATARTVSVHPNSVAYRLSRWREITGWDPKTLDGLTRSLGYVELLAPRAAAPSDGAVLATVGRH